MWCLGRIRTNQDYNAELSPVSRLRWGTRNSLLYTFTLLDTLHFFNTHTHMLALSLNKKVPQPYNHYNMIESHNWTTTSFVYKILTPWARLCPFLSLQVEWVSEKKNKHTHNSTIRVGGWLVSRLSRELIFTGAE